MTVLKSKSVHGHQSDHSLQIPVQMKFSRFDVNAALEN